MRHLLSKSKYIRGLQCAKAMYLDVHNPQLAVVSPETRRKFVAGRSFEATFKATFPDGIDVSARLRWRMDQYPVLTHQLLQQEGEVVLFEAGFLYDDVLVLADVVRKTADGRLHIYEVKNGAAVSPTFRNDVAVQHYVVSHSPFPMAEFGVVYNDGTGGFVFEDLLPEASLRVDEVRSNVAEFKRIIQGVEPPVEMGAQCDTPYECPYKNYCRLGVCFELPFSY